MNNDPKKIILQKIIDGLILNDPHKRLSPADALQLLSDIYKHENPTKEKNQLEVKPQLKKENYQRESNILKDITNKSIDIQFRS